MKCLAFYTIARIPPLYRLMQRYVTKRHFFEVGDVAFKVYGLHAEHARRLNRPVRALEFGAGPNLVSALLMSHAGAEVFAYDLERLASVEQVNHVIRQLRTRLGGDWPEVSDLDSDLLRFYRVHYCAPGDARNTRLAPNSIDFVCSTSTLEHIGTSDIAAILAECRRVATPDALYSFIIDYHDHYASADPSITRFNFYRYGDAMWRLFNPSNHYQNRLRHSDYERLFSEAELQPIVNRRIIPSLNDHLGQLAKRFRQYNHDDLLALNGIFLLSAQLPNTAT